MDEINSVGGGPRTELCPACLPWWGRALVIASVVLMIGGLLLPHLHVGPAEGRPGGPFRISAAAASALTGDAEADGSMTTSEAPEAARWAPTMFRVGFGFFVVFVAAYCLRACPRTVLLTASFAFILGFGLHREGLLNVTWKGTPRSTVVLSSGLADQPGAPGRRAPWHEHLPALLSGGLGLLVGLVRRP